MKSDRDFKRDIHIDENNLETEWLEQASLFVYYAELHAEALYQRDMAKSKLDLLFAKLYSERRKNWERYFDSKPTESALKEHILSDPKYQKAERHLISSAKDANLMLSVKTAFEHRKKALENLVTLKVSGFYAEPKNKIRKLQQTGGARIKIKENLNQSTRVKFRKRKKLES